MQTMKQLSLKIFWLILLCGHQATSAQPAINRIEYYIDTDPGYGLATNASFTGTTNAIASVTLNLASVSEGVHLVGVRSRDVNGAWSLDKNLVFLKPFSAASFATPQVTAVEWYFDNDPGYGNATPVAIAPAQNISGLLLNLDLSALGQGVHIVGVRSRDANGAWSRDNKWILLKPFTGGTTTPAINRIEYYVDIDPGYGNGTALSIVPGNNLSNVMFSLDLQTLGEGVHIVGLRSRDANGAWSLDNKWIFLKPYANNTTVPQVVKMEYYIDADPGPGNATPVVITPATNISSLIIDADISTVQNGSHKLGIRTMDENGKWSMDNPINFTGGTLVLWTGNASNAWNNAANWSNNQVPVATTNIGIPSGRPNNPVIANGILANCKTIRVFPSATITVATGGQLRVNKQ
jgi:hypothetical protein